MTTLTYYKDKANKHRWRIVAENGKTVGASSQGFASKQKAEENAKSVQQYLQIAFNVGMMS